MVQLLDLFLLFVYNFVTKESRFLDFQEGSDHMKIEKVNDNQIRCTLTKTDLADRQLKLSELAYGNDKSKELFREMMQQAAYEFGFEADNIPLMIEAIPLSTESIILIITKVEAPEELDTRFSQFSPNSEELIQELSGDNQNTGHKLEGADSILDMLYHLQEKKETSSEENKEEVTSDFKPLKDLLNSMKKETKSSDTPHDLMKLYSFLYMSNIESLSSILSGMDLGDNHLYKNQSNGKYYLFLHKNNLSAINFNKVCNILSEYGQQETCTAATEAYFAEHITCLLHKNALQTLASL